MRELSVSHKIDFNLLYNTNIATIRIHKSQKCVKTPTYSTDGATSTSTSVSQHSIQGM